MPVDRTTLREMVLGTVLLFALALPFLRPLEDRAAHIWVHFRTAEMAQPRVFSAEASSSLCSEVAAALSFDNPETHTFTQVKCDD